jgi:hypothetical protein
MVTVASMDAVTDDELVELWHLSADDAAKHRPWVCGTFRCPERRAALDECDAYAEMWLQRHPRP